MPVLAVSSTGDPQVHDIGTEELRNIGANFQGKLDSGELLTGTPTVTEVDTSDLVLTNKAVSTVELTIEGATVAIGEAVQFTVDPVSATVGKTYQIDIVCASDATNSQDLSLGVLIHII